MVLAYDLLENRRTIDVIITKLFFLCFKKAWNLENLDNTLSDWAKDRSTYYVSWPISAPLQDFWLQVADTN